MIAKENKFQYLFQAMIKNFRTHELINSSLFNAENYDKIIDNLESKFDKKELLIELYIHELLKLILSNAAKKDSKSSIINLYDKLETYLRALDSLNVITEICAAMYTLS